MADVCDSAQWVVKMWTILLNKMYFNIEINFVWDTVRNQIFCTLYCDNLFIDFVQCYLLSLIISFMNIDCDQNILQYKNYGHL